MSGFESPSRAAATGFNAYRTALELPCNVRNRLELKAKVAKQLQNSRKHVTLATARSSLPMKIPNLTQNLTQKKIKEKSGTEGQCMQIRPQMEDMDDS